MKNQAEALRPTKKSPELRDSGDLESLRLALQTTVDSYGHAAHIPAVLQFGPRQISRDDYLLALQDLLHHLSSFDEFHAYVRANFDFMDVYGLSEWGEVLSTGYYAPLIKGARKRTAEFRQPIYRTPADLVTVDARAFADVDPKTASLHLPATWQGRLIEDAKTIVPYYERRDIDAAKPPLAGRHLEIAYVDPIDAFFAQIQGSATVEFVDGKRIRIGYSAQNGRPYYAVGKALADKMPPEQVTMQKIRSFLLSLSPDEEQRFLNQNPSYVFFQELKGEPLTYSGAVVTPERTIASDATFFPKGALAFLDIETPRFADPAKDDPLWEARPRWVVDQDVGGAIRGGGRIDLYFGEGADAGRQAGVMNRKGRLWYVLPKPDLLNRLHQNPS